MEDYNNKISNFMFNEFSNIKNPRFLEFGVKEGRSTKLFLELCEKNDGKLISVDKEDYSNLFSNSRWKFINSRDDNFDYLDKILTDDFDVIYLDSLHEANHVEKIFYHYYKKLKVDGFFFIDDISWIPYLKNKERDNFYCEINNHETFEKLLEIYSCNENNFDISFSFLSSGICKIKKKDDNLNKFIKINRRDLTVKNFIRKFVKK